MLPVITCCPTIPLNRIIALLKPESYFRKGENDFMRMSIPEQLKKPLRQHLEELNIAAATHRWDEIREAMDTLQYVIDCGKAYYGLPPGLAVKQSFGEYTLVDRRSGAVVEL